MTGQCRPQHAAVMLWPRQGGVCTGRQGAHFEVRGRARTTGCDRGSRTTARLFHALGYIYLDDCDVGAARSVWCWLRACDVCRVAAIMGVLRNATCYLRLVFWFAVESVFVLSVVPGDRLNWL